MDVKRPAHAHAVGHQVGMFERKIHRVISPETAAGHCQLRNLVFPTNKRKKLMQEITFVLDVAHDSLSRMDGFVVPALKIDRIRAIHEQFAPHTLRDQRLYDSAVLILKKSSR